jgi:hypothetical protein
VSNSLAASRPPGRDLGVALNVAAGELAVGTPQASPALVFSASLAIHGTRA